MTASRLQPAVPKTPSRSRPENGSKFTKLRLSANEGQGAQLSDNQVDSLEEADFSDTDENAYQRLLLMRLRKWHRERNATSGGETEDANSPEETRGLVDGTGELDSFPDKSNSLPTAQELRSMSPIERLLALGGVLGPSERLAGEGGKRLKFLQHEQERKPDVADVPALKRKLEELRYRPPKGFATVPWIETLVITSNKSTSATAQSTDGSGSSDESPLQEDGNDLAREALFQQVCNEGVREAYRRLRALGVEASRPPDFMAEMLKSDKQMTRIRSSLADGQQRIKAAELRIRKKLDQKFRKKAGNSRRKELENQKAKNDFVKSVMAWQKERRSVVEESGGSGSQHTKANEGRGKGRGFSRDKGGRSFEVFGRSAEDGFDRLFSSTDGISKAGDVRKRKGQHKAAITRGTGKHTRQDDHSRAAGSRRYQVGKGGKQTKEGKRKELPLLPKKLRGKHKGGRDVGKGRGGTRRRKRGTR